MPPIATSACFANVGLRWKGSASIRDQGRSFPSRGNPISSADIMGFATRRSREKPLPIIGESYVQAAVNRNEPIIVAPLAIVVMGVSGSGKSTVGPLLAARLGGSFIEGDDLHDAAAVAMMRSGRALTDTERWPWLDRIGAAMARDIAARGIAVAACSALKRSYRDRIAGALTTRPHFVLLDNDPDELLRRLVDRPGHYMPPALLESQLATLERPTVDENALRLDTHAMPKALVDSTIAWLARADASQALQGSLE